MKTKTIKTTGRGSIRPSPYQAPQKTATSIPTPPAPQIGDGVYRVEGVRENLPGNPQEKSAVPRSRNVSGRTWKVVEAKRASEKIYGGNKALRKSWSVREAQKEKDRLIKERSAALKETLDAERAENGRRMKQRRESKAENIKKSAIVQKITDTSKIKKMSRKQFKQLDKM